MKKVFGLILLMVSCVGLTGCLGSDKNIAETFEKKVKKLKSYHISGELEIMNNEDSHKYNIDVAYKEEDNFRVSLKNKTNNHEQIILKNSEGVFVLTPSLNKSFKFQSEWPYNNSQSYLLQTLVNDIKNDKKVKTIEKKNEYIIATKVNYPNNSSLVKQKIYLDKKGNVKKVEVLNKENIVKIKMKFKKIDLSAKFDKKYFNLDDNMSVSSSSKETIKQIEDIIYPMYMPENTYLDSQETIKTDDGQRVILTFAGKSPFMIVEETVSEKAENVVVPVYGDPVMMVDAIGSMTENSANWISNGVEYYAVSEVLSGEKLLEVVNSINTIPVGK